LVNAVIVYVDLEFPVCVDFSGISGKVTT